MNVNNILNTDQLVQNRIANQIEQSNESVGDNFNLGSEVRFSDRFSFENEDTMNDLLNNIGLEVQEEEAINAN